MALIHFETVKVTNEPDPEKPWQTRQTFTREAGGATSIDDKYFPDEYGVFDVPQDVADKLCGFTESGWVNGPTPEWQPPGAKAAAKPESERQTKPGATKAVKAPAKAAAKPE